MSKKRVEREIRAAHRRNKKEKQQMANDFDDFSSLNNQLGTLGLTLKQIPGDGNCLFRALGDQLHGNSNDHFLYRTKVVNYMKQNRQDFEPFVEDDLSFDSHLSSLAESGTFAGNDSIVAFARLHDITVVIHQLNKPLWQIHGGWRLFSNLLGSIKKCFCQAVTGGRGRPKCTSVTTMETTITASAGWETAGPSRPGSGSVWARTVITTGSPSLLQTSARTPARSRTTRTVPAPPSWTGWVLSSLSSLPVNVNLLISASEVANLAGVDVKREVFDALELNAYCVTAAVDYLINVRSPALPPSLLPLYGAFDWVTLLISLAGLVCLTFSFAIWIILIILVIY